jgi:hypothetical protein
MDAETKQILHEMCAVLRDATEQSFYAHEMAEKVHAVASRLVPGFAEAYQSPSVLDVGRHPSAKNEILRRLDAAVRRLQK